MSFCETAMSLCKSAMSFFKAALQKGSKRSKVRLLKGHKLTILVALIIANLISVPALTQENSDTLTSTIVGNREQPKVLYIVPWKAAYDSEIEEQSIQSQLDIVFGHIERIELQRELKFKEQIEKAAKKNK